MTSSDEGFKARQQGLPATDCIGGTVMRVQGARTTEDAYAEAEKDNDKLRAEIDRLRAALVQIRGFVTVMGEHNWRDLRLHIERQCDALEQDGNGTPCHEGTTCYNSECARLGCLLDRERKFT